MKHLVSRLNSVIMSLSLVTVIPACSPKTVYSVQQTADKVTKNQQSQDAVQNAEFIPAGLESIDVNTKTSEDPVVVYAETVFPLVRPYCGSCHGAEQSPKFAVNDAEQAFQAVSDAALINPRKPEASRLHQRLASQNHGCWGECADNAREMLEKLNNYASRTSDISGGGNFKVTSPLTFADASMGGPEDEADAAGLITVEAETATLAGQMMLKDSDSASGGQAIYVANGAMPDNQQDAALSTDTATFNIQVDTPGSYFVFGRFAAPAGEDDSFHISVNNGPFVRWNLNPNTMNQDDFAWGRANDNNGNYGPFNLTAGTHTIAIRRREAGSILDVLALSTDGNFTGNDAPDGGPSLTLRYPLDDPNAPPELRPCPGTSATLTIEVQDYNEETWRFRNPVIRAGADQGIDYRGLHILVNDIENSQYATFELAEGTIPAGESANISSGAMLVLKENPESDIFQFRFEACGPGGSIFSPDNDT